MKQLSKSELQIFIKIFEDLDGKGKIFPSSLNKKIATFIILNLQKNNLIINMNDLKIDGKSYMETSYATLHKKFLEEEGIIKKEFIEILYNRLKFLKKEINTEIKIIEEDKEISAIGKDLYLLQDHHTLRDFFIALYNSTGDCKFKYIFTKKCNPPDININTIQQIKLFINSKIDIISYPARLHYLCNRCSGELIVDNNKISSNPTLQCITIKEDGKRCGGNLKKPTQLSDRVAMNIYDCIYEDGKGEKKNILAYSMLELEGGEYKTASLILEDNEVPYIMIMDVEQIKSNTVPLNIPTTHEQNILNIIDMFDAVIYNLSGNRILGMIDVKMMMVYQKLYHTLFYNKDFNIALKGDKDTGKNFCLENYGLLLFNGKFKQTNGRSISVPSLRGSAVSNLSMVRGNKNRLGLLALKHCIFIDEINMNKDLLMFLRPFLLTNTFSNDMADGDKIEYLKTALVNIAENPPPDHLGLYQGMIKKEYKELYDNPSVRVDEKMKWDDHWDLYQHLWTYTNNPLLYNVVKNVRYKFMKQDIHWMDGVSLPDKDRFIVDMFLKVSPTKDSMEGRAKASTMAILNDENDGDLRMKLNINNINDFFKQFEDYKKIDCEEEFVEKINNIIREYNFELRSRLAKACALIANLNRIINKRKGFNENDYDVVRRYLYMKNRAI